MLFTTPLFLFIFFPITLILYFLTPKKLKNITLLIASLIFYSWSGLSDLILIILLVIINYFIALFINKYRNKKIIKLSLFLLILLVDLGALIYFKYFNFFINNLLNIFNFFNINVNYNLNEIHLPLGLSFFTFQILSYIIDVFKEKIPVQKNIFNFTLYILLFPQLIAGPIVRYIDIEKQMIKREITTDKVFSGIKRFMIGFSKKILLSNAMGAVANFVFSNENYYGNMALTWIGLIFYALHIYHDFSAYSDMAIGMGKIFGFDFLENFNYPYISKSIQEFWQRWHISLSTWFRDYVYFPLGGSRKGKFKTYRNLIIIFFLTGFWHGASWTFIIAGLYHGFFIIFERSKLGNFLHKLPSIFRRTYTIIILLIGFVFFRIENLSSCFDYILGLFSFNFNNFFIILKVLDFETFIFFIIAVISSTPLLKIISKKLKQLFNKNLIEFIQTFILLLIFIISITYMTGSSYNPFIYFRF